ncbi:MAG: metalloregulator ArsR/SmtB family transcription factor [Bacteroidales bacterium]|nr:metalloregulator ArsR/SmtB family transcription factor [Bacteroidales bacterium]
MNAERAHAKPFPSRQELTTLSETFRLLGDPSRLKILLACLDAPRSVTDIAEGVGLSQSLVSHHLRLLRGARLVRGDRQSKQVFYTIADHHVRDMLIDMVGHVQEEADDHQGLSPKQETVSQINSPTNK